VILVKAPSLAASVIIMRKPPKNWKSVSSPQQSKNQSRCLARLTKITWALPKELGDYDFLAANRELIDATGQPDESSPQKSSTLQKKPVTSRRRPRRRLIPRLAMATLLRVPRLSHPSTRTAFEKCKSAA